MQRHGIKGMCTIMEIKKAIIAFSETTAGSVVIAAMLLALVMAFSYVMHQVI